MEFRIPSCFEDDYTVAKIMLTSDPVQMKRLGDQNFVPQQWERDFARDITYNANLQKFTQNPQLKERLLKSGNKIIIEGSSDEFWGCGIDFRSDHILNKSAWKNSGGLMSEVLMKIRTELRSSGS